MIVGNGLIASAFKKNSHYFKKHIVFASGVSNSGSVKDLEFRREFDLIDDFFDDEKVFIYFSTCSIYDSTKKDSEYVKHKLSVENYISEKFKKFIIYRLPNVVGKSSNPNTLTNYIFNQIKKCGSIDVYKNACRYLIDVDDVVQIVEMTKNESNKVINLNFDNRITMAELIFNFENILDLKVHKKLIDEGCCYCIDDDLSFQNHIEKKITLNNELYNYQLIKKYYG